MKPCVGARQTGRRAGRPWPQVLRSSKAGEACMADFIGEGPRVLEHETQALAALAGQLGEEVERAAQLMTSRSGRTIVTGVCTSGIVGRKFAASLASLRRPAYFVHATEAVHGDLDMITSSDVVIALSNSGETSEVVHVAPLMRRRARQ